MIRFWWRLRYAYTMEVYGGIPWDMAWQMSADSYEDNSCYGLSPRQAVVEDVQDWF